MTDGTAGGTSLVKDINANPGASSFPGEAGLSFLPSSCSSTGPGFLRRRRRQRPRAVEEQRHGGRHGAGEGHQREPGRGFLAKRLDGIQYALYFSADDGVSGRELWKTDRHGHGAGEGHRPGVGSSGDHGAFELLSERLHGVQQRLVFLGDDGVSGRELWKTDGTDTCR